MRHLCPRVGTQCQPLLPFLWIISELFLSLDLMPLWVLSLMEPGGGLSLKSRANGSQVILGSPNHTEHPGHLVPLPPHAPSSSPCLQFSPFQTGRTCWPFGMGLLAALDWRKERISHFSASLPRMGRNGTLNLMKHLYPSHPGQLDPYQEVILAEGPLDGEHPLPRGPFHQPSLTL